MGWAVTAASAVGEVAVTAASAVGEVAADAGQELLSNAKDVASIDGIKKITGVDETIKDADIKDKDSFGTKAGKVTGTLIGRAITTQGGKQNVQQAPDSKMSASQSYEPTRRPGLKELYAQQQQSVQSSEPQLKTFDDYFNDNIEWGGF